VFLINLPAQIFYDRLQGDRSIEHFLLLQVEFSRQEYLGTNNQLTALHYQSPYKLNLHTNATFFAGLLQIKSLKFQLLGTSSMSTPPPSPRVINNPNVGSSESLTEASNQAIPAVGQQYKSTAPPIMKTKEKKVCNERLSISSKTNNQTQSDIQMGDKKEIEATRSANEQKKLLWEKISKCVDSDGILHLRNFSSEDITDMAKWLTLSPGTKLTGLEFAGGDIDESAIKVLANVIESNPTVTELTLFRNSIGTESVKSLASLISNSQITKLELARNNIGAEGTKVLSGAIQKSQMTTLIITEDEIGIEGTKALAEAIHNSQITKLNLFHTSMGVEGAKVLANSISKSGITELILNSNNIGVEGGKALATAIPNSKINTLILHGEHIGNEGTIALAGAVSNSQITTLELVSASFSHEGTRALANSIKTNRNITTLNLSFNQIRTKDIEILADAILDTRISTFNISFNDIGVKGAEALAQLMRNNRNITKLDILGNEIGRGGEKYRTTIEKQCLLNRTSRL
jgi:Ran GTPase-activating protein (RanGAP) involved in mRNA processing and transport